MRINVFLLALLTFLFCNQVKLEAQVYNKKEIGGKPDPQLSQKDNDYLDRQAKVFLDTVTVLFPVSSNVA